MNKRAQRIRIGDAKPPIAPFHQTRFFKLVENTDHGRAGEIADRRQVFLTGVDFMLK